MGGADLSKLSGEAGLEKSDPHPKLTNLAGKGVGRARCLRKTAENGRDRTGQSRGGKPDRERECRRPRAAESGRAAAEREAGAADRARTAEDREGGADR